MPHVCPYQEYMLTWMRFMSLDMHGVHILKYHGPGCLNEMAMFLQPIPCGLHEFAHKMLIRMLQLPAKDIYMQAVPKYQQNVFGNSTRWHACL